MDLGAFVDEEIYELMKAHQLPDFGRYCLIFSPEFFDAIEQMPRFPSEDDLDQMKNVEWKPHLFLAVRSFPCEGKFMDVN